ncbi:MAG: hypothetical protein HOE48_05360 [Candidatus Latescibacteria bacterium]|jgi:flagellar biosynthesis protein|nr:hypothetical protein [Candidatus Latescibacterota bacterium]MBT4137320.1 hypothetical protein [Candidatus Latescibacterota bacterium]
MPDPTDNPKLRRIAAALGYDPSKTDAPKLMAKGQGDIADKIIELAKEHNIPIREDRDLVAVLAKLDLDQEIPPELYHTIAELLAFVYRANKLYKNSK